MLFRSGSSGVRVVQAEGTAKAEAWRGRCEDGKRGRWERQGVGWKVRLEAMRRLRAGLLGHCGAFGSG